MKTVVALYGLTGSGRLDLAARLQRLFGFDVHRVDVLVEQEFASWEASVARRAAFERMLLATWQSLGAGRSVVMAGCSFATRSSRAAARDIARRTHADFVPILLEATPEQAAARMASTPAPLREGKDLITPFFEDAEFEPVDEAGVLRIPFRMPIELAVQAAYAQIRFQPPARSARLDGVDVEESLTQQG